MVINLEVLLNDRIVSKQLFLFINEFLSFVSKESNILQYFSGIKNTTEINCKKADISSNIRKTALSWFI